MSMFGDPATYPVSPSENQQMLAASASHTMPEFANELREPIGDELKVCPGCGRAIVQGEHYIRACLELATDMPSSYVPVREVEPTVLKADVHNRVCLGRWAERNEILQNVFGR